MFAHGIGGSKDLPIPLELTIAGAVAALTVSFTVLAVAWRTPRYDDGETGRPAPRRLAAMVDSRAFFLVLRALGMLAFVYTVMVAVLGDDTLINPFFGIFYVLLWVGFVPLSLLFGPVYKAISPVRTINSVFAKLTGSDPDRGVFTYPEWLGHWPAALGLYAFVWMELVYPFATELGPVRLWCAAYVALMLLGGALFGSRFYELADPFEVYSTMVSRLSVWGRHDEQLVVRSPLANLASTPVRARPGRGHRRPLRQHGVRLVQGLHALGEVRPGRLRVQPLRGHPPGDQRRAARLRARRRADLHGRARC